MGKREKGQLLLLCCGPALALTDLEVFDRAFGRMKADAVIAHIARGFADEIGAYGRRR